GWGEVTVPDPELRGWFGGRERFTTFQWHYEGFGLPAGASRALTNPFNPEKAFGLGKHIGLQCHVVMTRDLCATWCRTGAKELPAQSSAAKQSREDIMTGIQTRVADLSAVADDCFARWARGLTR